MNDLTEKLYKSLEDSNQERLFKHWHASSIAECPRAHYMKRKGVPTISKPTGAKVLRWEAGHLIEEVIRPHLKGVYEDLISNYRMTSQELDLTGELDNYSPEAKTIIEIKSVGPRAVKYKKVDDTRHHLRDEQPYLGHELQNHAYKILLEEEGYEVDRIVYLYITLEGLLVPYTTEPSLELENNVRDRLSALSEAWENDEPPICLCQHTDHPTYGGVLQFCDYRTTAPNKEVADPDCCNLNLESAYVEKASA